MTGARGRRRASKETKGRTSTAVQRQPASTPHRVDAHARFGPPSDTQPTLRDLEFLDHEADRVVQQHVGARYGFEGSLDRPIPEDYDRIPGKRGEKSWLRQVLSNNRTLFPQLCPQEFLRLEHVRDPIKFDDLDLRLFTAGELNIIDRHDISPVEKRGRTDLLKNILYLAGYYEWRGILNFYATIINQIELGIKGWESDFSEERSLVLLPYALPTRKDRPRQSQGIKRPPGAVQNQNRQSDTSDSEIESGARFS